MLNNSIIQCEVIYAHNFESDLLFHQIALLSVKPSLTTTQNDDVRSGQKGKNPLLVTVSDSDTATAHIYYFMYSMYRLL